MAFNQKKSKGRRERPYLGRFAALPHSIFDTSEFANLSYRARALLIEFALQFNGENNGYLTATHGRLRTRGFTSKDQLHKALRELIDAGWIVQTRQGGRNYASLYALTYLGVDRGPYSIDLRPGPPTNAWKADEHAPSDTPPTRLGLAACPANATSPTSAPVSGPALARTDG